MTDSWNNTSKSEHNIKWTQTNVLTKRESSENRDEYDCHGQSQYDDSITVTFVTHALKCKVNDELTEEIPSSQINRIQLIFNAELLDHNS